MSDPNRGSNQGLAFESVLQVQKLFVSTQKGGRYRMARFLLICLIFTHGIISLAMADKPRTSALQDETVSPSSSASVGQEPETESKMPVVAEAPGNLRPVEKVPKGELERELKEGHEVAEAPENRKMGKHKRSLDESVAGGGVIIGGLATAILAAVFCYIRVTRRKHSENPF